MLFTSLDFLVLLVSTFGLYYLPMLAKPRRSWQLILLLIASFVFYGYHYPLLLILLITSGLINVITSYYVKFGASKNHLTIATIGVTLNLTILAFFKYSPLISSTFFDTDNGIGSFLVAIPLPIGISFFTFEGISLVVDTYRGHTDNRYGDLVHRSFREHLQRSFLLIVFFPHLIAGPILKAHDFMPQIKEKYFKNIDWQYCFKTLVTGYFLKLVVADNLNSLTTLMVYPYFLGKSSLSLIIMLLGYSFQIFADFAGYSLIALGLAGLFGYRLMDNFNFPYIATSFSEFWRRWHISLSTFLKEYLYFPLGGNRKGKLRTYANLFTTMILGGLWHGAAWSYAVWGAFHGLALALERLFNDRVEISIKKGGLLYYLKIALVFSFVTLAWLLFRLPEFDFVLQYLASIAHNQHIVTNYVTLFLILLYSSPVVCYHILYLIRQKNKNFAKTYDPILYGVMVFIIFTNAGSSGDFIYFQF